MPFRAYRQPKCLNSESIPSRISRDRTPQEILRIPLSQHRSFAWKRFSQGIASKKPPASILITSLPVASSCYRGPKCRRPRTLQACLGWVWRRAKAATMILLDAWGEQNLSPTFFLQASKMLTVRSTTQNYSTSAHERSKRRLHPAFKVCAAFIVLHPAIRTHVNAEGRKRGSVTQQAYRKSLFSKSSAECRSLDFVDKGPNGV